MKETFDPRLELLCQLSDADSLQKITDLGFQLFGNPLFISDMAHTILAYSKNAKIEDETWNRTVVQGKLGRLALRQRQEPQAVHEMSTKSRLPVLVRDNEMPFPRLVKTLLFNGRPIGVVVLAGILKPLMPEDIQLLELLSAFVTARTQQERYLFSPNEKAVENYLIKLLDGADYDSEQIKNRLDFLDWHYQEYLYVLVMSPDESEDVDITLDRMLSELSAMPFCRAMIYDGSIVLVFSSDKPITDWAGEQSDFALKLRKWKLLTGISRVFHDISHLREYYKEACTALFFGRKLDKHHGIFPYNFYSAYHLFQNVPSDVMLRTFCHEKILKLERYDLIHNSKLLITLQVYLEHARSLQKTADVLFVHRNTVRYRIKKCMEIMDSDLENGNDIFSFILSLRIIAYDNMVAKNLYLQTHT